MEKEPSRMASDAALRSEPERSPDGPVPVQELLVERLQDPTGSPPDGEAILEQLWLVVVGATSIVVTALARALARAARSGTDDWGGVPEADPVVRLVDVAAGAAVAAGGVAVRASLTVMRPIAGLASRGARAAIGPERADQLRGFASGAERWSRRVRGPAETAARTLADIAVPEVVAATMDRLDVTDMILARTDLDRIATALDIEAIVDRVPIDELAARVDVDALAARLDLDAQIRRLDLTGIARQVIDDIDLPEVIRESSADLSTETVDALRFRGMQADRRLSDWRRRHARQGRDEMSTPPSAGATREGP
jgi:hypothetical protein